LYPFGGYPDGRGSTIICDYTINLNYHIFTIAIDYGNQYLDRTYVLNVNRYFHDWI